MFVCQRSRQQNNEFWWDFVITTKRRVCSFSEIEQAFGS
jgi:hypothetical protein